MQALSLPGAAGRPAQDILGWPIGDVLVQTRAALVLGEQKLPVLLEQQKGQALEAENPSLLQLLAALARRCGRVAAESQPPGKS